MSVARTELADIDTRIARGEWWARLFDELSEVGMQRVEALPGPGEGPLHRVVRTAERLFRAVRLAVVAVMGLDRILAGLAALRKRSAADFAAARAAARAKADEHAAARARAEQRALARREGSNAEIRERVNDTIERSKSEPRDRDPLIEALDKQLAAVDPAIVDFDDLKLRETVLRICADLGLTPDWSRWEAGDWNTPDTPIAAATPALAPPRKPARRPPAPDEGSPAAQAPRLPPTRGPDDRYRVVPRRPGWRAHRQLAPPRGFRGTFVVE